MTKDIPEILVIGGSLNPGAHDLIVKLQNQFGLIVNEMIPECAPLSVDDNTYKGKRQARWKMDVGGKRGKQRVK